MTRRCMWVWGNGNAARQCTNAAEPNHDYCTEHRTYGWKSTK